jgi:hypothetical protein
MQKRNWLPVRLIGVFGSSIVIPAIVVMSVLLFSCHDKPIDRFSLVSRHNITNTSKDSLSSLSIGNGEFAFTVDITGLQTFPESYEKGIPLGTMSNWGWHTAPNPSEYNLSDVYKTYDVHGRNVEYVNQFRKTDDSRKYEASEWLRANPHRIHLGLIGLQMIKEDGTEAILNDISNPVQTLNLWTGEIESRFNVEGIPVKVYSVCHPGYDQVSFKIVSNLLNSGRLKVKFRFPYGAPVSFGSNVNAVGDHKTEILYDTNDVTIFDRKLDKDQYNLLVKRNNGIIRKAEDHKYILEPPADSIYTFTCQFYNMNTIFQESFAATEEAAADFWKKFWTEGGAVDFSSCTDPRAPELERRVILSQYLTMIQCSGTMPPAETGLTYNSWFGKFHLEMHWWHSVQFALWNRSGILEKQMKYYSDIYENAAKTAEHQGYKGVRWPKMVGPDGRESPSSVGTYLIWQEPHVIFFAELLYKNAADKKAILEKYNDLVFATADFMASYAWFDKSSGKYVLGPVLIPAQESLKLETTINPVFELVYWHWALNTASKWRDRLGMDPEPSWKDVAEKISPLPVLNAVYLCSEDTRDSYSNPRYMSDHPIVSGVLGVMPQTSLVDNNILLNSLDTIQKVWNWKSTWGWDFPMLAMSAAAAGRGEQAIDFLMMNAPKNRYLANGHNYQDARLSIYLPGNGGLLTAVAKMSVYNQFPKNGKWNVKWENLNRYLE